ncbi:MAG: DUF488 family protein [Albidovulum sp.]
MSVLFTVGYEGTDIDRFVRTLKAVGVEKLADVQAVAVSRKAGFSKTKLAYRGWPGRASSIRISSRWVIPSLGVKPLGPENSTALGPSTART